VLLALPGFHRKKVSLTVSDVLKKPVRIEYGTNQKRNEDAVQTTSGKEEEAADE
jgi:hypothetical protein